MADEIEPHARPKGGIGQARQIEITLFWGRDALATKHFRLGSRVRIGSVAGCDLLVPREALGIDEHDIVESRDGAVVIHPPPGSSPPFVLAYEHVAELKMGAFSVAVSVGEAPARIPRVLGLTESWGLGVSALVHGGVLAALAFFMPSLGQAEQEGAGREQLISMKAYLDAAAERVPTVVGSGKERTVPVQPAIDWTARDCGMIDFTRISDPDAWVVPVPDTFPCHPCNMWADACGGCGFGLGLSGIGRSGGDEGCTCECGPCWPVVLSAVRIRRVRQPHARRAREDDAARQFRHHRSP